MVSKIYSQEKKCFRQKKMAFHREAGRTIVTYNHERELYIKTSDFIDELKYYESTIPNTGPCLYVKEVEF
ncbi:hypothetical protein EB796_000716 [Bugula neritina]|uniref:Uncharacterized protein n=1 Tax=Bugula neritina TaxID=10212 RepID=A0A7J7KS81_BUGNE|nr:hypothetical protein EB796_000716 [Bugula neritina]